MIYAFRTEIGLRDSNQDFLFAPEEDERPVVIVADGMGGHRAGNIASRTAVECIHSYIEGNADQQPPMLLQHAVSYANRRIFDIAANDADCMGMGTTVVMAYVESERVSFAHVGDSRLYHFDGETIRQATRDHSYVEELVRTGVITRKQAEKHPQRNILTRAVGTSQFVKTDTASLRWKRGDVIMLCSDGLYGSVPREEMVRILSESEDLLGACDTLTETALENGSTDNVTVVLVKNTGEAEL